MWRRYENLDIRGVVLVQPTVQSTVVACVLNTSALWLGAYRLSPVQAHVTHVLRDLPHCEGGPAISNEHADGNTRTTMYTAAGQLSSSTAEPCCSRCMCRSTRPSRPELLLRSRHSRSSFSFPRAPTLRDYENICTWRM